MGGVAQGGAQAGGPAGLQGGDPRLDVVVPVFGKTLDVQVTHIMAGIGVKSADGEGVAQLLDAPGEQRHGLPGQFQDGRIRTDGLLVERLGQVEQQQHGDIAAVGTVAHVDARVGVVGGGHLDVGAGGRPAAKCAAAAR